MMIKYYLDTCIWRDHYENRTGFLGRKLGKYATNLFKRLIEKRRRILFSRLTYSEMKISYTEQEIDNMLNILFKIGLLEKVEISDIQIKEALNISNERNIPKSDALHAILARDNGACIVTQDKHFDKLADIVKVVLPEEV